VCVYTYVYTYIHTYICLVMDDHLRRRCMFVCGIHTHATSAEVDHDKAVSHYFSNLLFILALDRKCTRALTIEYVRNVRNVLGRR